MSYIYMISYYIKIYVLGIQISGDEHLRWISEFWESSLDFMYNLQSWTSWIRRKVSCIAAFLHTSRLGQFSDMLLKWHRSQEAQINRAAQWIQLLSENKFAHFTFTSWVCLVHVLGVTRKGTQVIPIAWCSVFRGIDVLEEYNGIYRCFRIQRKCHFQTLTCKQDLLQRRFLQVHEFRKGFVGPSKDHSLAHHQLQSPRIKFLHPKKNTPARDPKQCLKIKTIREKRIPSIYTTDQAIHKMVTSNKNTGSQLESQQQFERREFRAAIRKHKNYHKKTNMQARKHVNSDEFRPAPRSGTQPFTTTVRTASVNHTVWGS